MLLSRLHVDADGAHEARELEERATEISGRVGRRRVYKGADLGSHNGNLG